MTNFTGRVDVGTTLKAVLRGETKAGSGKLSVLSIEGPGGIGKTSFFDHVCREMDLDGQGLLVLRVGGTDSTRHSVQHALRALIGQPLSAHLPSRPPGAWFPGLVEALSAYDDILREAQEEFAQSKDAAGTPAESAKALIDFLVGLGRPLNAISAKTRDYVDFDKVHEHRENIDQVIDSLAALRSDKTGLLEKLGMNAKASLRNALKENPLQVFAQRLNDDLTAILAGYEGKDFFKPKIAKVDKLDRLLLVFDDYEVMKDAFERLLIDHFFPLLRGARFETVAVIIGRDRLRDTASDDWNRQLGGALLAPIALRALRREELDELAKARGLEDPVELERGWRETGGYPLFAALWLDEANAGGDGVMTRRNLWRRTTRWMTDDQRRWLEFALVLDFVDKRQFRLMLGEEAGDEAERAFAWFENDGSVREPVGDKWRVREYLRSRLIGYIETSDPDRYEELTARRAYAVART